jgi:hypothetical protein
MNNYINKNILIDELLELNITYNDEILYSLQELKDNIDYKMDIILLNNITFFLDGMIDETNNYLTSIVDSEFEYITVSNIINNLYNAKYRIYDYLKQLNETDILTDMIDEIKL